MNQLEEEYRIFTGDAKTFMKQLVERHVIIKQTVFPIRSGRSSKSKVVKLEEPLEMRQKE